MDLEKNEFFYIVKKINFVKKHRVITLDWVCRICDLRLDINIVIYEV